MAPEPANSQTDWHRLELMNHRIGRLLFGFGVGFVVAFISFKWITNPAPRAERELEEHVVSIARPILQDTLAVAALQIVDPLAPNRKIGKSYVYRADSGWEVSGYYRRTEGDRWHPFLMRLDSNLGLVSLKVRDAELVQKSKEDPILEALP